MCSEARPGIYCNHDLFVQYWQLLSAIHADIDERMSPSQWAGVLLPPIHVPPDAALDTGSPESPASRPTSPQALPGEFAVHRAAARAQAQRSQRAAKDASKSELLQATGGCAFPSQFEPNGLGPVEASVVAELVLEVRPC